MAEARWTPLPLDGKLFLNVDEAGLSLAMAAIENGFQNEAGGFTRFPGLKPFATLPENGRCYGVDYRGDMIVATSSGRLYRLDKSGNVEAIPGVAIGGATSGHRVIFAETENELAMAAGAQIVRFAGGRTEILSENAPISTHIGFIDSYLLAIEHRSGRFWHSVAGDTSLWEDLDTFAADGSPDNIISMLITPFREVMLCGPQSIEQFERLSSGDVPFFRRWSVGEGIKGPDLVVSADNGLLAVNQAHEVVRISGQVSEPISGDIGRVLSAIDDWTDAWIGGFPSEAVNVAGQTFIILQMPKATNIYGTKGVTFVLDLRKRRWSSLFGWDPANAKPVRWPGWSHWRQWDATYVGGEGKIYRLDPDTFMNDDHPQRFLVHTGHWSPGAQGSVDNLRIRVKRGIGTYETEPVLQVRAVRDNKKLTNWKRKGLGKSGHRELMLDFGGFGFAHTFQFQILCPDNCPVEIFSAGVQFTPG